MLQFELPSKMKVAQCYLNSEPQWVAHRDNRPSSEVVGSSKDLVCLEPPDKTKISSGASSKPQNAAAQQDAKIERRIELGLVFTGTVFLVGGAFGVISGIAAGLVVTALLRFKNQF